MNKTYVTTIVVLVLLAGGLFFMMNSKELEAPVINNQTTPTSPSAPGDVACTMDAKICPDGSSVGRVAPTCEFAACPSTSAPVKEFVVTGQNFSFSPSTIIVKKGDRVKITFKNTQGFHDFKIDEYSVAAAQTKSPAEEVLEFTADKVGTFEYYCSVGSHRAMGMKGTLKVE